MSLRSVLLYAASAGSWVFKGRAFTGPTGLSGFDSDTTEAKRDRGCGAMGEPVGLVAASNSNMDASTVSSACIGCCADSKYCDGGSGAEVWGRGRGRRLVDASGCCASGWTLEAVEGRAGCARGRDQTLGERMGERVEGAGGGMLGGGTL